MRLVSPPDVHGGAGADRGARRHRRQPGRRRGSWPAAPARERSLNVEGSYRHILTDLYGFIATAVAAVVILVTGFWRADAIASLLIAGLMLLRAAYGLLKASGRVFMEAAPGGHGSRARSGAPLAAQPERGRGPRPARVGGHLGVPGAVGARRGARRRATATSCGAACSALSPSVRISTTPPSRSITRPRRRGRCRSRWRRSRTVGTARRLGRR